MDVADFDPDEEPWKDDPIWNLMKNGEKPKLTPPQREPCPKYDRPELIEFNECSCCGGNGFVKIIHENKMITKKKRKPRNAS